MQLNSQNFSERSPALAQPPVSSLNAAAEETIELNYDYHVTVVSRRGVVGRRKMFQAAVGLSLVMLVCFATLRMSFKDFEGAAGAQYVKLLSSVGVRQIAQSSSAIPQQEPLYIDANPGAPNSQRWGPWKPGKVAMPGTLPKVQDRLISGGLVGNGDWKSEACVEPPCGVGIPEADLSGPRPGLVAGWLGRRHPFKAPHPRMSTSGPGWLAYVPSPQAVNVKGYEMNRHLHWLLFNACADASVSMELTATCVRRYGRSVQSAISFLRGGPSPAEREKLRGGGTFADRMFQRYLQSDPYLLGEDWPRSTLQFQPPKKAIRNWQTDPSSASCKPYKVEKDMGADALQSQPVDSSSRATMVTEEQCCSLCTSNVGCKGFQFTAEDQSCELYQSLPSAAVMRWEGALLGTLKEPHQPSQEKPLSSSPSAKAPAPSPPPVPPSETKVVDSSYSQGPSLPPGWKKEEDKDGKPYYVNPQGRQQSNPPPEPPNIEPVVKDLPTAQPTHAEPAENDRGILPENIAKRIGYNEECHHSDGRVVPCVADDDHCGNDGSGRGPDSFDAMCASGKCGWKCNEKEGEVLGFLECFSCDGGNCRCVPNELEEFVRRELHDD